MTIPIHPELEADGFNYDGGLWDLGEALNGHHQAPAAQEIAQQVIQLGALLLKKNTAYGDSALNPVAVFAPTMSAVDRMAVRMDDKLSRISRGAADGEDVEMDLAGYLVLQRIAKVRAGAQ